MKNKFKFVPGIRLNGFPPDSCLRGFDVDGAMTVEFLGFARMWTPVGDDVWEHSTSKATMKSADLASELKWGPTWLERTNGQQRKLLLEFFASDWVAHEAEKKAEPEGEDAFIVKFNQAATFGWNAVDEAVFDGTAWYSAGPGRPVLCAQTSRGNEWIPITVQAREFETEGGFQTTDELEVSNLYERVMKLAVQPIIKKTNRERFFFETQSEDVIDEMPWSCLGHMVDYRMVKDEEGGFLGWHLKGTSKIPSVRAYLNCALSRAFHPKRRMEKPCELTNDPNESTFRYLPMPELKALNEIGDWSNWQKWFDSSLMYPETQWMFMAWVGSCMDAKNAGKQVMWVRGDGNDGKSKVAAALSFMFNSMCKGLCGTLNEQAFKGQFAMSAADSKRVLILNETKNPNLLRTQIVHMLSGGDEYLSEEKGKQGVMRRAIARLVVFTNTQPCINVEEVNQATRLLYIPLRARTEAEMKALGIMDENGQFVGSNKLEAGLVEHAQAFKEACVNIYAQLCPTHADVPVPKNYWNKIAPTVDDTRWEKFKYGCEQWLEVGTSKDFLSQDELSALEFYPREAERNPHTVKEVRDLLLRLYPFARVVQKRTEEGRKRGISGLKLKNS